MYHPIYLEAIKKNTIAPNFFCSVEFFNRAKIEERLAPGYVYWYWNGVIVHPPLDTKDGSFVQIRIDPNLIVWSDFPGFEPDWGTPDFLDYEFIFNPADFLTMEGGKWQVFRKNCRKFPRRFQGNLTYRWISEYIAEFSDGRAHRELEDLFISWLKNKPPSEEIQGDYIMMDYLHHGKNRKVLHTNKGVIYGINIWDSNDMYINYRFTFNLPEDFLSEYMRILFYTDPVILHTQKLVNDGGCVGSESLKRFKEKMNPISVREVRSWK